MVVNDSHLLRVTIPPLEFFVFYPVLPARGHLTWTSYFKSRYPFAAAGQDLHSHPPTG